MRSLRVRSSLLLFAGLALFFSLLLAAGYLLHLAHLPVDPLAILVMVIAAELASAVWL